MTNENIFPMIPSMNTVNRLKTFQLRRRSSLDQQKFKRNLELDDSTKNNEQIPWSTKKTMIRRYFRRQTKKPTGLVAQNSTNSETLTNFAEDINRLTIVSREDDQQSDSLVDNERENPYLTYFYNPKTKTNIRPNVFDATFFNPADAKWRKAKRDEGTSSFHSNRWFFFLFQINSRKIFWTEQENRFRNKKKEKKTQLTYRQYTKSMRKKTEEKSRRVRDFTWVFRLQKFVDVSMKTKFHRDFVSIADNRHWLKRVLKDHIRFSRWNHSLIVKGFYQDWKTEENSSISRRIFQLTQRTKRF